MLQNTRLPVNRIAEQCGYGDYFYFERLFKRTYGVTPTRYREGMPLKTSL
jgi:two-component system response regulator YesN